MEDTKITNRTLSEMLVQHFKDDDIRFEKLDKALERAEKIAIQNGEHFSYFNKNLEDIKKTLDDNKRSDEEHRKRIEPVIKAYEDKVIIERNNEENKEKIIKTSKLVGAVGVIGSAIIYGVTIIKKLI